MRQNGWHSRNFFLYNPFCNSRAEVWSKMIALNCGFEAWMMILRTTIGWTQCVYICYIPRQSIRKRWGSALLLNWRQKINIWTDFLGNWICAYVEQVSFECCRLSKGIRELVEKLQSRGTEVYLVSGGFRQMIAVLGLFLVCFLAKGWCLLGVYVRGFRDATLGWV